MAAGTSTNTNTMQNDTGAAVEAAAEAFPITTIVEDHTNRRRRSSSRSIKDFLSGSRRASKDNNSIAFTAGAAGSATKEDNNTYDDYDDEDDDEDNSSSNLSSASFHGSHGDCTDHNEDDEEQQEDEYDENGNLVLKKKSNSKKKKNKKKSKDDIVQLAQDENRWVWRLRLITALVLACVAIGVCLSVYFVGRTGEKDDFETDFIDLGDQVVTSFKAVVQQRFGVLENYAAELTAYATTLTTTSTETETTVTEGEEGEDAWNATTTTTTTNNTTSSSSSYTSPWPFVTPPQYTYRATNIGRLAHLIFMFVLPKVQKDQLQEWNEYAVANQGWKTEGVAVQYGLSTLNPEDAQAIEDLNIAPIAPQMMNAHYGGPPKPEGFTPGPYYPIWAAYPIQNDTFVNVNLHADVEHAAPIDKATRTGQPTFEKSYDYINSEKDNRYNLFIQNPNIDYQDDPFTIVNIPIFNRLGSGSMQQHEDTNNNTTNNKKNKKEVVAVLFCFIYWRDYFVGLLPPGSSNGIIVVLENDCGQQFTYKIDGRKSTFIGFGDLHDPNYDHLATDDTHINAVIASISNYGDISDHHEYEDTTTDTVEFPDCHYSMRAYPSKAFEESHYTYKPWMYAVVVGSLFLLTSAVFLVYDFMVERRQMAVMKSAQRSGKLVASLFPEVVRERLYAEQEAQEQAKNMIQPSSWQGTDNPEDHLKVMHPQQPLPPPQEQASSSNNKKNNIAGVGSALSAITSTTKGKGKGKNNVAFNNDDSRHRRSYPRSLSFNSASARDATPNDSGGVGGGSGDDSVANTTSTNRRGIFGGGSSIGGSSRHHQHNHHHHRPKEAIASIFPETTIFFADIAGFTEWSSNRGPSEVFHLLETIYGAFDMIALRRKVFKVETIGDCYLAVTGLPEPQPDHAEIMVKFANECMTRMNAIVTTTLSDSLGPDTADLAMRVGLHSGPVTAGVLRGQKSRFQLFGDTVNTASRMESNGEKNRIHISQSTADCMVTAGKASWLICREGTIYVKGKGDMQTYWINRRCIAKANKQLSSASASASATPSATSHSG